MNTLTRRADLIYTDWTLIEPEFEIQSSLDAYPDNNGFDHWEQLDRGEME